MDAEADALLKEARPLLEAASRVLHAAGHLHRGAILINCKEAEPILARVAGLRFGARLRRGEHTLPSQPAAKATPAPSSSPSPKKDLKVNLTPSAAIDKIAQAYAFAGTPLPAALIERGKARGDTSAFSLEAADYAAPVRVAQAREAEIDKMVSSITGFIPGPPLTSLRSLAASDPVTPQPEASEDDLVASIVAFIPPDRRRDPAFDND